jgi:hypothetical protein
MVATQQVLENNDMQAFIKKRLITGSIAQNSTCT